MYNSDERALIWLNSFSFSAPKKNHLINNFMSPAELVEDFNECKDIICSVLNEKNFLIMRDVCNDIYIDKLISDMADKHVKAVTMYSDDYPTILSDTLSEDTPIVLYYIGNIELFDSNCFAIVGNRRITRYGRDVTEKFARELTLHGFTIVSGMARGVDSVAHTECLKHDGNTIAVLGTGLDIVYPSENRELYRSIAKSGLVISEYPLGTPPTSYNFPHRNRIITALSRGVLVTEAGMKSGSMISANLAIDQGKDLFVVPGSIFSEQSLGCNALIKNNTNTFMVTTVNDILEKYDIRKRDEVVNAIQLDFIEQSIVKELENGKLHFEEILSKSNLEVSALFMTLTGLEVSKVIRKIPGNFYELQPN